MPFFGSTCPILTHFVFVLLNILVYCFYHSAKAPFMKLTFTYFISFYSHFYQWPQSLNYSKFNTELSLMLKFTVELSLGPKSIVGSSLDSMFIAEMSFDLLPWYSNLAFNWLFNLHVCLLYLLSLNCSLFYDYLLILERWEWLDWFSPLAFIGEMFELC